MSYAHSNVSSGQLTSTGSARILPLEFLPDFIEVFNLTNQNSVANPGVVKQARYFRGMADGSAFVLKNTNGAAMDESSLILAGGFTPFDSSQMGLEASKSVTSITQANPAVVTVASHGYAVGDIVRFFNVTGMQQIGSMDFEVLSVPSANTFTIPLDSSGFAAAATGGSVRRHKSSVLFLPKHRYITKITQASSGVVTTSTAHGYVSNQYVRISIAPSFGMFQLNDQLVKITVLSATTFSINVDTSGYSAFAFPASGSAPFQFPMVVPAASLGVGETVAVPFDPFNLVEVRPAFSNRGYYGIVLGSAICGVANDVLLYRASKSDWYMNLN